MIYQFFLKMEIFFVLRQANSAWKAGYRVFLRES